MKATGIVRRIDELGRVVIPKEIRRTHLIRVGDPLEIYVSNNNEVIFKKYSPLGELAEHAQNYVDVTSKSTGLCLIVTDKDNVIAAHSGAKELLQCRLSAEYERTLELRRTQDISESPVHICKNAECEAICIAPIMCNGDIIGSVALVCPCDSTQGQAAFAVDKNSAIAFVHVAASVLGKQLED